MSENQIEQTLRNVEALLERSKSISGRNMVCLGWIMAWTFVSAVSTTAIAVHTWLY